MPAGSGHASYGHARYTQSREHLRYAIGLARTGEFDVISLTQAIEIAAMHACIARGTADVTAGLLETRSQVLRGVLLHGLLKGQGALTVTVTFTDPGSPG